jgi:hypothetical protein
MNSIVRALLQIGKETPPQVGAPPPDPATLAPQNPFAPNIPLEQQTAPNNYPVNPLVLAMAQKFGLTNLIRNTQNAKQAALQEIQ